MAQAQAQTQVQTQSADADFSEPIERQMVSFDAPRSVWTDTVDRGARSATSALICSVWVVLINWL